VKQKREAGILFDTSRYVDLREASQLPHSRALLVNLVTALLTSPGRFDVTDQRVYWQALDSVASEPVRRFRIGDIARMYKRRYTMRHIGLELFFFDDAHARSSTPTPLSSPPPSSSSSSSSSSPSSSSSSPTTALFVACRSVSERDTLFDTIAAQATFPADAIARTTLVSMQQQWRAGTVSNYDYLMFLNERAGRSMNDLTQYPVMPWLIADYDSDTLDVTAPATFRDLTKPVGALNADRLASFRERMESMVIDDFPVIDDTDKDKDKDKDGGGGGVAAEPVDKRFLYGTHYSTPGYVLFFLVRREPQLMLRLQCGRFDHADRLFTSTKRAYHSCTHAMTDVKELLPEFYDTGGADVGGFLVNSFGLRLGQMHTGAVVDDVELPPWAHGDAALFVRECRRALESEYVSARLHHWIDLIFGYKQRGAAAYAADNVFYHLTYEGAVDVDAIDDPAMRRATELQSRWCECSCHVHLSSLHSAHENLTINVFCNFTRQSTSLDRRLRRCSHGRTQPDSATTMTTTTTTTLALALLRERLRALLVSSVRRSTLTHPRQRLALYLQRPPPPPPSPPSPSPPSPTPPLPTQILQLRATPISLPPPPPLLLTATSVTPSVTSMATVAVTLQPPAVLCSCHFRSQTPSAICWKAS
jgi:factor associated with neutral sphingomyelinase activation